MTESIKASNLPTIGVPPLDMARAKTADAAVGDKYFESVALPGGYWEAVQQRRGLIAEVNRLRAALTDLATNDKLYNERAMRTAAAALSGETAAPSQRDCRHMWTVRSMRDPQPDHVCAHGCGFTWKQRCAQELRGGPET